MGLLVELLVPVVFAALMILFKNIISTTDYPNGFSVEYSNPNGVWPSTNIAYYYDPSAVSSTDVNKTLSYWESQLKTSVYANSTKTVTFKLQDSMSDLENWCQNSGNSCIGAVVFNNLTSGGLHYTIRIDEDLTGNTKNIYNDYYDYSKPAPYDDKYWDNANVDHVNQTQTFWTMQNTLDRALTALEYWRKNGKDAPAGSIQDTTLARYPYLPYTDDGFAGVLQGFGFYLIIGYIYSVIVLTRNIVQEKELRLKEAMKLMGLRNWVNWISWWVSALAVFSVSIFLWSLIFYFQGVDHSDFGVLFLFFLSFALSTISFCFMISSFFDNSRISSAGSAVLFFLFYVPYTFLTSGDYGDKSQGSKMLGCLCAPTCAGFGTYIMGTRQNYGQGVTFSNWSENVVGDSFTFQDVVSMMFFDFVLYMVIALYVEAVFPGKYGIPEKFYYFLTPSYWCGNRSTGSQTEVDPKNVSMDPDSCEEEPAGLKVGVQIQNLRKQFGKFVAVNSLSVNMYEGQITSFLGHNGAGKTTTMNMLTGMFPCSGGDAFVNGYSIKTNIKDVRSSLGLCPQFDILFTHMTVAEHLEFYCLLKNVEKSRIEGQITGMLEDLQLLEKRHVPVMALSRRYEAKAVGSYFPCWRL